VDPVPYASVNICYIGSSLLTAMGQRVGDTLPVRPGPLCRAVNRRLQGITCRSVDPRNTGGRPARCRPAQSAAAWSPRQQEPAEQNKHTLTMRLLRAPVHTPDLGKVQTFLRNQCEQTWNSGRPAVLRRCARRSGKTPMLLRSCNRTQ